MSVVAPDDGPRVSVVIASVNGRAMLEACLGSLERQTLRDGVEVIVVDCCPDVAEVPLRDRFPWIQLIKLRDRRSIPELRAIGIARARAQIIAITEDHKVADPRWIEEMLKAHQDEAPAIGGAIENGCRDRLVDWAAYLSEYLRYAHPLRAGVTDDIPGPNASYKRSLLDRYAPYLAEGFWDVFFHWRLRAEGVPLRSVPSMVVYHAKRFGFREFLTQRYHFGRSFGGMRRGLCSPGRRLVYILASPLLPPLILWRIARLVIQKRRFYREFILTLPLLVLFALSWSLGEVAGYLFGAGDSTLKVA